MGLRGGCGVGAAGCLWIGSCFRRLWCLGGFGAVVFGTLLRLELEGSREGILYDEIYITILNWKIIVYFIMPKYFDKCYFRHGLWTLLMRARILLHASDILLVLMGVSVAKLIIYIYYLFAIINVLLLLLLNLVAKCVLVTSAHLPVRCIVGFSAISLP